MGQYQPSPSKRFSYSNPSKDTNPVENKIAKVVCLAQELQVRGLDLLHSPHGRNFHAPNQVPLNSRDICESWRVLDYITQLSTTRL